MLVRTTNTFEQNNNLMLRQVGVSTRGRSASCWYWHQEQSIMFWTISGKGLFSFLSPTYSWRQFHLSMTKSPERSKSAEFRRTVTIGMREEHGVIERTEYISLRPNFKDGRFWPRPKLSFLNPKKMFLSRPVPYFLENKREFHPKLRLACVFVCAVLLFSITVAYGARNSLQWVCRPPPDWII